MRTANDFPMAPRGPEGILNRMEQLRLKIASIQPKETRPPAAPTDSEFQAELQGKLSGLIGLTANNPFAPASPVSYGLVPDGRFSKDALRGMARQVAAMHDLDFRLFDAMIMAESGYNPSAISDANAAGLTQLMPGTAREMGVKNPLDPMQNLNGGARYLKQMLQEFNGDTRLALAAYNAGPNRVRQVGGVPYNGETERYVERVLSLMKGDNP